jgi:hypothetical protein
VKGDVVTLGHQELGGHFAEAVGGAGDKDVCHAAKLGKLTVKAALADEGGGSEDADLFIGDGK